MNIIRGKVERGEGLGKTIGFPTINVTVDTQDNEPGIYVCEVSIGGETYHGAGYLGEKKGKGEGKDLSSTNLICEVFLFEDCGDVYDEEVEITLLEKIRESVACSSLEELKPLIEKDVEYAKTYLNM